MELLRGGAVVMSGAHIYDMDVLLIDGAPWLVPTWAVSEDGKSMSPACLIPLAKLPHSDAGAEQTRGRYLVQSPLSSSLLDGQPTPNEVQLLGIRAGPRISFPNPDGMH